MTGSERSAVLGLESVPRRLDCSEPLPPLCSSRITLLMLSEVFIERSLGREFSTLRASFAKRSSNSLSCSSRALTALLTFPKFGEEAAEF